MSLYLGDKQIAGISTPVQGRVLGQIIHSLIPLNDAGLHLADGSLINGNGSYSAFYNYMLNLYGNGTNPPAYFTDETTYQNSITTYGVCGKFVIDTVNKTIRLPKITGMIEGTINVSALGDLVEAGLPNITATFSQIATTLSDASDSVSGALYIDRIENYAASGSARQAIFGGFDASRSNSIYNNSNTVQPQTIKAYIYIVIATLTKTDIEIDINNIATDLNNKADKDLVNVSSSDVRNTLDNAGVRYIIETYVNGSSWYNLYSNGWIEQGGKYTYSSAGQKTISLLKSIDITRPVYFSYKLITTRSAAAYERECNVNSYTSSNFVVYTSTSNGSEAFWEAKGYIL